MGPANIHHSDLGRTDLYSASNGCNYGSRALQLRSKRKAEKPFRRVRSFERHVEFDELELTSTTLTDLWTDGNK